MAKIKIKYSELNKKSTKELSEIQSGLKLLLMKNPMNLKGGQLEKGRNIKEEKRNLARVSQILNNRINKMVKK